ncbi:MAG: asparaginase [Clostridium sp.]|uniref:asparaginase n=1 Tax=Clostridium sp. TaxID=1506 RepID=UPI002FC6C817
MKKVAVIFNGGTISMKVDEKLKAAVPSLSSEEIMAKVTGIDGFAEIETYTFSTLPGPHMTPEIMLSLSKTIKSYVDRDDISGVVVTHGTDTLEETAYLVDLTLNTNKPVIFTGAMRSSSELGYDGPANLAASICTAVSEEAVGRGVMVCLSGYLNLASEVTKTNSMSLDTFKTPNFGPIGIVDNNRAIFYRDNEKNEFYNVDKIESNVSIIKCGAGMDSRFLDYCIDSHDKGIVLEAMGRGNVPDKMVPGIRRAIESGIPVVLVSRCFEGRVNDSYGYEGGGRQLREMGVIFGDTIPGQKARIKLMVTLSALSDVNAIRQSFEKN